MSAVPSWDEMKVEKKCVLCVNKRSSDDYKIKIKKLKASTLYLNREQRFRGYCLLILRKHVASLPDLSKIEYEDFMNDVSTSAGALSKALNPDHLNYELLGNTVPHLHWHIIPRYKSDPRWGRPIWEGWQRNEFNINRYDLSEKENSEIINKILKEL